MTKRGSTSLRLSLASAGTGASTTALLTSAEGWSAPEANSSSFVMLAEGAFSVAVAAASVAASCLRQARPALPLQ